MTFLGIDGVGTVMATSLVSAFQNDNERAAIDRLISALDVEEVVTIAAADSPVAGKTVVFTGTLTKMSRARSKSAGRKSGG